VFDRLKRVVRFHERVVLPDIDSVPHQISHAGRVVASYPPSPSWAVRLPLWAGLRKLGQYAPSTARRKRKLGLPDDRIVLYHTGALYESITVRNMKKYYLITVKRDKLSYIIRRFPVRSWLRVDADAVRHKIVSAVLVALTGCASLKRAKQTEIVVRHEEVVTTETLRLTTTLRDTIYMRNERLVVHYDTLRQVLRIEQVRPVTVRRDSIVIERTASPPAPQPKPKSKPRGLIVITVIALLAATIVLLWRRALKIG